MANNFTHIYIEQQADAYPLTEVIKANFPAAIPVRINSYREVFHRPNQAFRQQKNQLNLILAVKRDKFIYAGSDECQDSTSPNFFYTTPMINCIYDCHYCYLQGKYPSANLLVYVNQNDFYQAVTKAVNQRPQMEQPLLLAISYDADLLAVDHRIPLAGNWIEFARQSSDLLVEIRTKSAWKIAESVAPTANILLSWSLSPTEIIDRFEPLTPSLDKRVKALLKAIKLNWPVRLCIDPVIHMAGWERVYRNFFNILEKEIPGAKIHDLQAGFFRMGALQFKQARKVNPANPILRETMAEKDAVVSYPEDFRQEFKDFISDWINRWIPLGKVKIIS